MKTAVHVATILLLGVVLGLTVRSLRQRDASPPADAEVYSNDGPLDPASVTEDEPAMAPDG
jgi:hypothetical protein